MRRKPNRIGLTLTDYRTAMSGYKDTNRWAIWGYNNNVGLQQCMSQFMTFKKQNRQPLKRTRRIGIATLHAGIKNDTNKVLLKWAKKRLLPEARAWMIARFPQTAAVVRQSEASQTAGAIPQYELSDIKPGGGPIETIGSMIDPKWQMEWDRQQAAKKKG